MASWVAPGDVPTRFLWTDLDRSAVLGDRAGMEEMRDFCLEHRFALVCVDDVFNRAHPLRLQHVFNLLRLQGEWAAASDILRYEVLHRFGGAYADTDVTCLKNVPWGRVGAVPGAPDHRFAMGEMDDGVPTQAALFATRGCPVLATILDGVEDACRRTTEEVLERTPRTRVLPGESGYTQRRMDEVLARTGPTAASVGLLSHVLGTEVTARRLFPRAAVDPSDLDRPIDQVYGIYSDQILGDLAGGGRGRPWAVPSATGEVTAFFKKLRIGDAILQIDSAASWLGVRRQPTERLDDARIALTTLLFRLVLDPTVLDLVPFESDRRGRASTLVSVLGAAWGDQLGEVTTAVVGYEPRGARPRPRTSEDHRLRAELGDLGFDTGRVAERDIVRGQAEPLGIVTVQRRYAF